ncbi:competence/damage-inducible protein A [candidate division CSSED10-310 bacterium]|uniref:Competence/damage-inducible protein A n=1 Tax=candidate division CSSED10-310 bacterium TaxID=2855610 RepID=A0ABV6YSL6_UNCC1
MEEKTVGIIIVGNEILSGRVQDTNSYFFCQELFELGIKVARITTLPDQEDIIAEEVKRFADLFDVVFVAGGIGPTHDDITLNSIATGLNKELIFDARIEELMKNYFGNNFDPSWLKMAHVPQGTELIAINKSHLPIIKIENIYIFPGIPEILEKKFDGIKETFRSSPFFRKEVNVDTNEAKLVPILERVVHQFPDVQVGSYPISYERKYSVRLTIESKDQERAENAFLFLNSLLKLNNIT